MFPSSKALVLTHTHTNTHTHTHTRAHTHAHTHTYKRRAMPGGTAVLAALAAHLCVTGA